MNEEETPPPSVYKVIGAPGTGKTTRVVGNPELPDVTSLVMENLDEYPIDDQMIVTYTNAGVDEAAERLQKILDAPKTLINERVVTIHAHCYRTLGVNKPEVVSWWHKQDFCKRHDLEYGHGNDDGDIMSADQDEGHALFDIYGWLKSNRKSLDEYGDCPLEFPGHQDVQLLMEEWEEYKKNPPGKDRWKNNPDVLYDFSDMIEMVVEQAKEELEKRGIAPVFGDHTAMEVFKHARDQSWEVRSKLRGFGPFIDSRVLYVDEVQDLTPLQWAWYLAQKIVCEKVYIGGDDDQTIYGWAGANPNFMLDEEGDFEVLDKTYRIPADIWEVCDDVIRQVDRRQEKEVKPHGEGGDVDVLHAPRPSRVIQYLQDTDKDCFILFRARYMIDEFTDNLHEAGIPYRNMSTFDNWTGDFLTLREALAKLKNGADMIKGDELEVLMDYAYKECPRCYGDGCSKCDDGEVSMLSEDNGFSQKERVMGNLGSGITVDRINEIIDLSSRYQDDEFNWRSFLDQCTELNYYEKEALKGNLRQGNEDMSPERVRVGTIHSAKGKEADVVILATDSTQRILENMLQDTRGTDKAINDAERRLYYVGMTRASEQLVLAQGLVERENCINVSDLIENYTREEGWESADTEYATKW